MKEDLVRKIAEFVLKLNYELPRSVKNEINRAYKQEKGKGKVALKIIRENFRLSKKYKTPLCQDTGIPIFFVELTDNSKINRIKREIEKGTELSYKNLRQSMVKEPFLRKPTKMSPFIFFEYGKKDKIKCLIKGGGCENVSKLFHFKPTESKEKIINEISAHIIENCVNSCPPLFIGIGMGGDTLSATYFSYKALLRKNKKNKNKFYADIENKIKEKVNASGLGPQGWGGKNMVLQVRIEGTKTHIASFTVSVVPMCHSFRKGELLL